MAFRGRTPLANDNGDRSYDSSPDPLAISMSENTTMSSPRKNTPRRRPLISTSPSKQSRRSSVAEVELSSPTKAMILNTPRMGNASPWRIKVTVQAEPGSDEENDKSPSVKRFTRTQTTTVPLKDPDAPAPMKRGRGRPRKSNVGSTPRPKRSGTPVKRIARSESQEATLGAAESSAADVDTDAPPKRKRGRPRKNARSSAQDEDTLMILESRNKDRSSIEPTPGPATKSRSSAFQKHARFATPQIDNFGIDAGAPSQPSPSGPSQDQMDTESHLMQPARRRKRPLVAEYEMPIVDTPPKTELGARLRARKNTPHVKKVVPLPVPSDEDSNQSSDFLTPTSGEDNDEPMHDPFIGAMGEAEHDAQNLAGSHGQVRSSPSLKEDEQTQDAPDFAFDEGTTRMPDDTTVMDSENFSMISVDSLPSSIRVGSTPRPEEGNMSAPQIGSMLRHEYLKPSVNTSTTRTLPKPSPAPSRVSPSLKPIESTSRPALRRFITPVIDTANPSAPPVIEPAPSSSSKPATPGLGRVVTAGVVLQGVLDPARLTPEPSQKMLIENHNRLDDLFRGFSEGTKRDLQAGLRLGEQLAQGEPTQEQSSPARSSPIKSRASSTANGGSFTSHQSRLPTPEDRDDQVVSPSAQSEVDDVQYPVLDVAATEKSLPSPARSEEDNEMSWRVDTPPVATGNTGRMRFTTIADQPEEHQADLHSPTTGGANASAQQEDYSDIWQEEASRSSNSADTGDAPQVQDLFEPGPLVPARGKLPQTWRRKSGNHFQYSDEAESPQRTAPSRTQPSQDVAEIVDEGDTHGEGEGEEDEDAASDASDDTGMFFQSNMPSIFSKRHSRDLKQRKAAKLDLTMLMNEGESMVPESSPPVPTKKSSPARKSNPFLNTPPHFPGVFSSPSKSSPLRRELRESDISSESHSRVQDESSLPLPQSSPFHTYIDGESKVSVASDQRQLFMEMEGVTESTIVRVRNEADEYSEAYELQERSLNEIEEVTESSRTWLKDSTIVTSSPPQMKVFSPIRKRVPLFQSSSGKPVALLHKDLTTSDTPVFDANKEQSLAAQQVLVAPVTQLPPQRPTSLLTRMTSSLWSAVTQPTPEPAPHPTSKMPVHPIIRKLTALPKIEPWTKTHYKTMDRMYDAHTKSSTLFDPHAQPATAQSRLNAQLLKKFISQNGSRKRRYVDAIFAAWGYEFDMTDDLIVLCQVYCDLMSLDSIEAYETLKGRKIEVGDCIPGSAGQPITGAEVARRLATVILGIEVREAEAEGEEIDRTRGLMVKWAGSGAWESLQMGVSWLAV